VGDSFSFCYGVEASDCWVTRLEEATRHRFVDLGLPGTGSLAHYEALEEYLRQGTPRLVLWQFFMNDFHEDWEAIAEQQHTSMMRRGPRTWLLRSHAFLQNHSAIYALIKAAKNRAAVVDADGLNYVLRPAWIYNLNRTYSDLTSPDVAAGFEATKASLDRAARLITQRGGQLVVVVAPVKERVYWERLRRLRVWPNQFDPGRADAALTEFCRQRGIAIIDLFDALHQAGLIRTDLYFEYDDHWTPAGNVIVANQIREYLERARLLPTRLPD
jgi:hypothetical protein